MCSYEDFVYCGLRHDPYKLEYEYNKNSEVTKCNKFNCDVSATNRRFRCDIKDDV